MNADSEVSADITTKDELKYRREYQRFSKRISFTDWRKI